MKHVCESGTFWGNIPPFHDAHMNLRELASLSHSGHDVYFITQRSGVRAKEQTEDWLMNNGFNELPTVLLSDRKALCCEALALDFYIDDKQENCESCYRAGTNTLMLARGWNRAVSGIPRIPSMTAFFDAIKREAA